MKPTAFLSEQTLAKVGRHCSTTERRADDAERELIKVKLLLFLRGRLGDEMDAVITGVESFGLFCQGIELPVDGMIHITALDPGEYFDHDADRYTLVGRRSGKTYRLGDRVRVVVAHVDVERRKLDFRLASSKRRTRSDADEVQDARPARGRRDERAVDRSDARRPRGRRRAEDESPSMRVRSDGAPDTLEPVGRHVVDPDSDTTARSDGPAEGRRAPRRPSKAGKSTGGKARVGKKKKKGPKTKARKSGRRKK